MTVTGMTTAERIAKFLDQKPAIDASAYIASGAVVIGAVSLAKNSSIWHNAVLRGDINTIDVGEGSNIQDGTIGHVTHDGRYTPAGIPLCIGEDVTVGHAAILHACSIGDRCLVGMGALVLDGAVIEADVMLGAGSLVAPGKRLESGWLYRGRPAVAARRLRSEELELLAYSAAHYVHLKDDYLSERMAAG